MPADLPGRGLTRDGHLFQAVLPALSDEPAPGGLAEAVAVITESAGGPRRPAIAALPLRVGTADVARLARIAGSPPPSGDGRFLLGVSEFRSRPVELDLARAGSRLLVYGDSGSGRTTLLRRITTYLRQASGGAPGSDQIALGIVDPGRGLLDLADGPGVIGYAANVSCGRETRAEARRRTAPESGARGRGGRRAAGRAMVVRAEILPDRGRLRPAARPAGRAIHRAD